MYRLSVTHKFNAFSSCTRPSLQFTAALVSLQLCVIVTKDYVTL